MAEFRVSYDTGSFDKPKLVQKTFKAAKVEEAEFGGSVTFFDDSGEKIGAVNRVVLWEKVQASDAE